jgi:CheY-like chemotaxis protein
MSYPLTIQPLVIEDEEDAKETYEGIFQTIASEFSDLPFPPPRPCFAFSHQEAVQHLDSSRMFHVVILDLRLPEKPKLPPADDVELGLNLLERCLDRDRFPIPALLVISGHIGSTEQARMQDTLREGFHYGRLFVKGDYGLLEQEIRKACKEAIRWCSVGIHLRSSGEQQFPVISPREEDLLRRSVLQQKGATGLDLNWWSAKKMFAGVEADGDCRWTNVLMGRYLLDGDHGASRPLFFKLLPTSDARPSIESVRSVEYKLNHIKLTSSVTARTTGLIVTEKVGAQDARPKSLEEFLTNCTQEQAFQVAAQIANQAQLLGDLLPDSRSLKKIFWPAHDHALLTQQWERLEGPKVIEQFSPPLDPIALYAELTANTTKIRVNDRAIVHGDLHIGNVALDIKVDGSAEAYIFDPGVVTRTVAGRDLAVLEVSLILHEQLGLETVQKICSIIYSARGPLTAESAASLVEPLAKNTVEFIRGLREAAVAWNDLDSYALMVFDFALVQFGGLAYGSSGNRIWDPRSALYLLIATANWYKILSTD